MSDRLGHGGEDRGARRPLAARRKVLVAGIAAGLLASVVAARQRDDGGYDSPHYHDGAFHNLDGGDHRGFWDVVKWKLGLEDDEWPYGEVTPWPAVPQQRPQLAALRDDACLVTWLGHSTLLVRAGGVTLLTDPVWGNLVTLPRRTPPPVALDELPPIDAVLISHNHRDHLELEALARIAKRSPAVVIVAPLGLGAWLAGEGFAHTRELDWYESTRVGDVELTAAPAQHWSRRGAFDDCETHWASWHIRAGATTLFFGGDSAWFDGFAQVRARLGPVQVALLPIGAYRPRWIMSPQHLDPYESLAAAFALEARVMVPIHWGAYVLGEEPLGEPPALLKQAARLSGFESMLRILPVGGALRCGAALEAD